MVATWQSLDACQSTVCKKQVRLGGAEERFAFQRAVSRLHEMQTDVYLARRARC